MSDRRRPRRNLIPLVLLLMLLVLTVLFAALGFSSSPNTASLTVQNATTETFGGSSSFTMVLAAAVAGPGSGASAKSGTLSSVRLIDYRPPDRMAVYGTGTGTPLLGLLNQAGISCALGSYIAIVGGSTPWSSSGSGPTYTRTESVAEYFGRVPEPVGSTCAPRPTSQPGQVRETAVVRSQYLVELSVLVVVQSPSGSAGTRASRPVESETLELAQIGGTPVKRLR